MNHQTQVLSITALLDTSEQILLNEIVEQFPDIILHYVDNTFCNNINQSTQISQLFIIDIEQCADRLYTIITGIKTNFPSSDIVLIHTTDDITLDIELMKLGILDAIKKPIEKNKMASLLNNIRKKVVMSAENLELIQVLYNYNAQTIISHSPEMEKVLSMASRAAQSNSTVLITGESGTGKELIARAIHLAGNRKHEPFIAVNIAALPENLIESELFGHIKGAFTGALADRNGRFAQAAGGTLFIDEIGEIPPGIQVKLLRVLQFGVYERVGEATPREANVRIIAATNRNLEQEVKSGNFRAGLFYRINVVPIEIPPLREHKSDIPYLVEYFLKKYARKNNKEIDGITIEAMSRIMRYPFPGNIRELENIIERGVVLCRSKYLTEHDILLPFQSQNEKPIQHLGSYEDIMHSFEKDFLMQVLERNNFNKSAAARELGINERRLRYRIQILGIEKEA
ncbi:MAG TPA: sigma-54 dependent transcriptional regulator [Spirochaetales bacterium]|nr:sigma-54 dependent transcriptional regulator [Spirochaetales bacterium]